jgi:type I restriction enzyme S subunit
MPLGVQSFVSIALAFTAIVEAIQGKIAANHAQGKTVATHRDTLLPGLISGELRLPETEATVENVL